MGLIETAPWLVMLIALPLSGATLAFLCGGRGAVSITLLTAVGIVLGVSGLGWQVWRHGPQRHSLGGWGVPLGIDLYADGLSALMLIMSVVVGVITSFYAVGYFAKVPPKDSVPTDEDADHGREGRFFWPLWLLLWAALHALFLSTDVFNLYITLELLGLAAVGLVNLAGDRAALTAGMRYFLLSMLASLAYLLGVALLYAAFGVLDLAGLGAQMTSGPVAWGAIALMTLGLTLKTALFPLHFWLPPAHANAPAPVSALLSALVVKASFYLLLRLWFEVFPAALTPAAAQGLGLLGAAAILWGSVLAVRQQRLKLLVAYSTVAQIGYLFMVFPLATTASPDLAAWSGGVYHALSHACAKASMFLAVGTLMRAVGHDRIPELEGIGQALPMPTFAFALAGITLMGLPPSGGFIAKWLLLTAAVRTGQWWWGVIILVGGLLAAGYVFRILRPAFVPPTAAADFYAVPRSMELSALVLALVAVVLGLAAQLPLELLAIGAPFPAALLSEAGP